MHSLAMRILELFKQYDALRTGEVVSYIYASAPYKHTLFDDYADSKAKKEALAQKAQLHRHVLYHLHALVEQGFIRISRIEAKGEKVFTLALAQNQQVVLQGARRIILQTRMLPLSDLESYEQKKILYKFEPTQWIEHLNALAIDSRAITGLDEFSTLMLACLDITNDVLGILDIERLIGVYGVQPVFGCVSAALKHLQQQRVCIVFNATNFQHTERILEFFELCLKLQDMHISYVFDVTSRELMQHHAFFVQITQVCAQYDVKFNIKNDDVHHAPYIVGRAGPYAFSKEGWEKYQSSEPQHILCLSQATIIIDEAHAPQKASEYSQLISASTKALFMVHALQYRDSQAYFRQLGVPTTSLFSQSSSCLRYLNVQVRPELYSDIRTQTLRFAQNQENIYNSCGLPLHFTVGHALAYRRFNEQTVFDQTSEPVVLDGPVALYSRETKIALSTHETQSRFYAAGYEVRVQKNLASSPQDCIGEISLLLNTYTIPLFCYKFMGQAHKNAKLETYYGNH